MDKRMLPSNVDPRIKLGPFPLFWNLLIFLPFLIFAIIVFFAYPSPMMALILMITVSIVGISLAELAYNETGLDLLKDILKYLLSGNKYIELGDFNEYPFERYTYNQKFHSVQQSKKEE